MTKDEMIACEKRVAELFLDRRILGPVHLSGGNEETLIRIFNQYVKPHTWVLSSHRWHYHYLLKGGTAGSLIKHICDHPHETMTMVDREMKFMSTGIVGGMIPIAVGLGRAGESVMCFIGDGAAEKGYFTEALAYVQKHRLPVIFVIENNRFSCDTPVTARLGSFVEETFLSQPYVIQYTYFRTYPHVGVGQHVNF